MWTTSLIYKRTYSERLQVIVSIRHKAYKRKSHLPSDDVDNKSEGRRAKRHGYLYKWRLRTDHQVTCQLTTKSVRTDKRKCSP